MSDTAKQLRENFSGTTAGETAQLCLRAADELESLASRLDKTEKSEDGWRTQAMGMSKRVIELESRLETYRKAATFRDNGYDCCRFCRHRAHMGEEIPHDDYCPLVVEKL